MDEDFEEVFQQVQLCCPVFKCFACISWERALFGKRGGDGLSLMQLWSRLIEGRSFWWVLRTSWTGFPEEVWLSSLWERKKREESLQPSPADTSLDIASLALRIGDGGLKAEKCFWESYDCPCFQLPSTGGKQRDRLFHLENRRQRDDNCMESIIREDLIVSLVR